MHEVFRGVSARHDVIGENAGKLVLVLWFEQRLDGPGGQFVEGLVNRREPLNGPGLTSGSTRPAAFTAATSVVWSFELTAFSTMFFEGNMGAPPTSTVFSIPA